MKKTYISILFLLLGAISAFGQEKVFEPGLSFGMGLGFPMGTWAGTDKTVAESGYALPGFTMDLTYHLINAKKRFGYTGTVRYTSFGYDSETAEENYRFDVTGKWEGDAQNWKMIQFAPGVYWNLSKPGKNTSIEFKVQAGILQTMPQSSAVYGLGQSSSYKIRYFMDHGSSTSFTYLFGLNLKSRLAEKANFLLNLDYTGAGASIPYDFRREDAGVVTSSSSGSINYTISSLMATAGVVFML